MERREGMSQILQPPQGVLLSTSGSRARGGLHCAEPLQEVTGSTGCSPFTPGISRVGHSWMEALWFYGSESECFELEGTLKPIPF